MNALIKQTQIILIGLLTSICTMYGQTSSNQLIHQGQLVNVYLDKAIYHSPEKENFLLKFIIENKSDSYVGVDLTDYWQVIYPNQWGIYNKPYREVINEERMSPDMTINEADITNRYKNKALTFIKPNDKMAYYRDWNGSGQQVNLTDENSFFIITIDGLLLITDGQSVEQITIGDEEDKRAIVFKYPIIDRSIPDGALIIDSK